MPNISTSSLVVLLRVTTKFEKGVENRAYMGQDRSAAFDAMGGVILRSCVKALSIRDASFPTVSISVEQWGHFMNAACRFSLKEVSLNFMDYRELADTDFLRLLESKDTKQVSVENCCLPAPSVLNRLKVESSKKKLRISEINNRYMNQK